MPDIQVASRLREDGSLTVPREVVEELGLRPGDEVLMRIEARASTPLDRAVAFMTNRTPEQIAQAQARAMAAYQPVRAVPPGKTLADMVSGEWPGAETDAEIEAALEELS